MNEQPGAARHDPVFAIIVFIANAYLIAFAADGGLSLVDEVLRGDALEGPLKSVRAALAGLVVVSSFGVLLLTVLFPRLPKHVLMPLAVFAIWCGFGAPPLVWPGADHRSAFLVLSLVQLALAAGAFGLTKAETGHWLLKAGALPRKSGAVWRIALAGLALLIVAPLFVMSLLAMNVASMIQEQTDGYVRFTSSGIELQETILENNGKSVRLVGMLHVGEPRFYEALYASFPRDALILEEGATDRTGRLGNFSYRRFAGVLGLTQQPRLGGNADAEREPSGRAVPGEPGAPSKELGKPYILNPDIDVSEFSESTIRFLGKVGEIYQSASLFEAFERVMEVADAFTPEEREAFYEDVVHKRNRHVLAAFDTHIAGYSTIVVPWGALHMPELEREIEQRGYTVVSRRRLPLVEYATILRRGFASPS